MTYNVFGWTLNLAQSINHQVSRCVFRGVVFNNRGRSYVTMCSQLLAEVERSVSRIFDDRENTAAYNRQHCVMGAYTCQLSCCRPDQHRVVKPRMQTIYHHWQRMASAMSLADCWSDKWVLRATVQRVYDLTGKNFNTEVQTVAYCVTLAVTFSYTHWRSIS